MPSPALETVVSYLLEAPKMMRDMHPVQWQFLDAPPDNTMFLTWQPSDHMGLNFASDGYVWGDPEQLFDSDVRGYVSEPNTHQGTMANTETEIADVLAPRWLQTPDRSNGRT